MMRASNWPCPNFKKREKRSRTNLLSGHSTLAVAHLMKSTSVAQDLCNKLTNHVDKIQPRKIVSLPTYNIFLKTTRFSL